MNLWMDSILLDIQNNVQKKKNRTPTVFHKASLSLHILSLLLWFYNKAEMDGL